MGVDAKSTPFFMLRGFQQVANLAAFPTVCAVLCGQTPPVGNLPMYSSASIVNAATNRPGPIAANGLASLYGKNLAFVTRAIGPDDLRGDILPTALAGTGLRVSIGSISVPILFVSPSQVNFLVPPSMRVGRHKLLLTLNSRTGPEVDIDVSDVSPGAFPLDANYIIATHADGRLVEPGAPAQPGQILIVYASGLGQTIPRMVNLIVPRAPAQIERLGQFRILLNDTVIAGSAVLYAGLAPGFAGLYQINLRLPAELALDPELRIAVGEFLSPEGLRLHTQPAALQ